MRTLLIWGSGGHGRVIFDIATAMGVFDDIVFYDDRMDQAFASLVPAGAEFVIAIGANKTRAAKFTEAVQAGLSPVTCVHPRAWISPSACIGLGTVLMPQAVVQAGATVGVNCIVNTGAVIEHDGVVGDHAHLSPGAMLGGGVHVGAYAHLGMGAIAIPGATIGSGAVVGAGAVVLREVEADTTVVGIPARLKKSQSVA